LLAEVPIRSDPGYLSSVISIPTHCSGLSTVAASQSIMSDTDVDTDEALLSVNVRELCDQLRANDPCILSRNSTFEISYHIFGCSEAEYIEIFQALKENTSVKHIRLTLFERYCTKRSALVAAEYLESSKTLQILHLGFSHRFQELPAALSLLLRALSRNTSVTELGFHSDVLTFASMAFQELLTSTQTLQKMVRVAQVDEEFNAVQIASIASGFASNTTLRDIKFKSWREADLAPVLTALQRHPALEKIHFNASSFNYLPSLSGLEDLLRSQDSKVKELVLEKVDTRTAGLRPVMRELGHNTTLTSLTIRDSGLNHESVQELQAMLRQNTTLQYLSLHYNRLLSAGLAEIAPALYHNTSIKSLDLSRNSLDEIESANLLRELIRRNKTITSLSLAKNAFGRNSTATGIILEGLRSNTALQHLDLGSCELDDHGISILANALAIQNASILELNLQRNEITSMGVRALVDDHVEVMKTLTKLCLSGNSIRCEGATILANALEDNAMPSLKQLQLARCCIDDGGFVALVSALEENTSLQILDLGGNTFGERGLMALAESLPTIKGLKQIKMLGLNESFRSTVPLLLEGFRKNTSLVEFESDYSHGEWSREVKFLGQRNRFTPLLKASEPPPGSESPQLGIWSLALAKVATEPDVLFHVLCNKPKLVRSHADAADSKNKRKRDD
jgi:Ran GTPase-activating protein (RanGAP) involved in mRNA processing and transport